MYLYGASGHAKVVIDILRSQGKRIDALIDDNSHITNLLDIPVVHSAEGLSPIIITIGDCNIRKKIAENLVCDFDTAVHSSAIISNSVNIGIGSVVMQGAIVQSQVTIGKHCIINTKASVDHECVIEDYVHIAPGCTISGDVRIGECSWIGVGTTIIQGVHIGKNCYIGAGSVIVNDIPDNSKAYGVPCKIK